MNRIPSENKSLDILYKISLVPVIGTIANISAIMLKCFEKLGGQLPNDFSSILKNHSFTSLVFHSLPLIGTIGVLARMCFKNKTDASADIHTQYNRDGMPIMDPKAAALLYKMQQEFDQICDKHQIRYAGCSGTVLGALRHDPAGIIPWDDDIDLVMPLNEQNKFTPEFHQDLLDKGLKLRPHWGGFKLTVLKCPEFGKTYGQGSTRGEFYWPFIDLFITYKNVSDSRLYINCQKVENLGGPEQPSTVWPKESWTEEELENTKKVPFGPISIPLAEGADEYCKRAYGNDCMEIGYQIFDHKNGRLFDNPHKAKLTDFSPCPYEAKLFEASLKTIG